MKTEYKINKTLLLSPSIHKFDDVFIYSIRPEQFGLELTAERLMAEGGTKYCFRP